jgi:hypothetical protein
MIVEDVYWARYMTNEQIARLHFSLSRQGKPTSQCKRRTRYLFDRGYLKKRKTGINEPDVYYLGLKGRRYVAQKRGLSQEQVDKVAGVSGGSAEAPFLMMRHDLTLSTLYVNARLDCQRWALIMRWWNERMLQLMNLGFQPDAFVCVEHKGIHRGAFLEFTSVVPPKTELTKKIEAYEQYLESSRWGHDLEVDSIGIMWLTTTRSKAQRIWEQVMKSDFRDCFLVGLIEDAGSFLTESMWRWSEEEEKTCFVPPPQEVIYQSFD